MPKQQRCKNHTERCENMGFGNDLSGTTSDHERNVIKRNRRCYAVNARRRIDERVALESNFEFLPGVRFENRQDAVGTGHRGPWNRQGN